MNLPQKLYIFSGLPGTGKSTLARLLANHSQGIWLRIDTIEQSLRESGVTIEAGEGYAVAYGVATDNLKMGRWVVADSVNPIALTRHAWHGVADAAGVSWQDIEIVCSNPAEHQQRVEARRRSALAGEGSTWQPTWKDVVSRHYEDHEGDVLRLDTAAETIEESFARLIRLLK